MTELMLEIAVGLSFATGGQNNARKRNNFVFC